MKYLKTYKIFESNQSDMINDINDILLNLSDIGYNTSVEDLSSWYTKETLEIIVTTRPEKFDWDKWKDSVSDEELIMVKREKLRERFYSLYEDEVKPVIETVKRYLTSQGYNMTIEATPEEYLEKSFFSMKNKMFTYRFYFQK